jgi:hypothetical protein
MGRPFTVALQAANASSHGCAAHIATTPAANIPVLVMVIMASK